MLISIGVTIFNTLRDFWEKPNVSRTISLAIVFSFMFTACAIVLNKMEMLPAPLSSYIPTNPFQAIQLAFSLVLGVEVIELIIAIADSVSLAVGKQLEIMALLLLRETFTDISLLNATIDISRDYLSLLQIAATAIGGISLFILKGIFSRWRYTKTARDARPYINAKKCVSLLLLATYFGAGLYDLYGIFILNEKAAFFQIFYTALIFTDILLVLAGQIYMPCFHATFRNSGYAVATLLMRISLGAPHYLGAALCVFAALYIIVLTWAAMRFAPPSEDTPPPMA